MGSVANAGPVDVQTAKDIGVKYLNASVGHKAGAGELQLVKTYFMGRGDAAFYVFSTASSFVIVSAQDVATPILGYSDEGPFDADAIPAHLKTSFVYTKNSWKPTNWCSVSDISEKKCHLEANLEMSFPKLHVHY